jgi:hypothetical protein
MSKTLKQILDEFGWENLQHGELPSEIKSEPDDYSGKACTYNIYALNGVCVITENNSSIVELSFVENDGGNFMRKASMPQKDRIKIGNINKFMEGFKLLHTYYSKFAYSKEMQTDFQSIGKRMKDAGELYKTK